MTQSLRIVFAGTPDFAAKHLSAILATHHQVVGVYSQPDRPAGRGKKLQASPVKQLAQDNQLPVFQPETLKSEDTQAQLAQLEADVMVVVAYGLLLPVDVLKMPAYGCLNVHGSLLPRWRGAAPIQRAIWAGDTETGVTIMQMDEGLDTGDMLIKQAIPIDAEDTSATLYEKLAIIGPQALCEALDQLQTLKPEVQDDTLANYAKKLSKEEARMDWSLSAVQLARNVRAFNPWPVSFFPTEAGPVKVWEATSEPQDHEFSAGQIVQADKQGIVVATSEGVLRMTKLQLPGKKPLAVQDILNARKEWFETGTILS